MHKKLSDLIEENQVKDFRMFLYDLGKGNNKYLLKNDLLFAFEKFCNENEEIELQMTQHSIYKLLMRTPEIILMDGIAVLMHRHAMAKYRLYKIHIHNDQVEEISKKEFLDIRDRHVRPQSSNDEQKLQIDFLPFYDYSPNIKDVKKIGKGVDFLNKHMASSLFQHPEKWNQLLYEFLKIHQLSGQQLLISGDFSGGYEHLQNQLDDAIAELESLPDKTPYKDISTLLKNHGFEPGWGDIVGRIRETMQLLLDLFQAPDSGHLENFISRIPMISKIAIISPHGWFGQEKVLGRPDTGGQIVYILDQVRALEKTLSSRLQSYGLTVQPKFVIVTRLIPDNDGTTSNEPLEKINKTENCYILRVPFTEENGSIVPHWLSRFKIWPYLERFAHDARIALQSEFEAKPDLIIGNYSDGNLVATLLSEQMQVTQCNIAHALEKTKYLFSDLYWFNFEDEYHFSVQFMADLISMNLADFIITSTFQEIAGTKDSGGQYESYLFYTMPDLVQIENGVNLFHPKFNVIPPGVDEHTYFPYSEKDDRLANQRERLYNLLFEQGSEDISGHLKEQDKRPIFTMARLDHIKNITGLVEAYGQSTELQEKCNLIVVAGKIDAEKTDDAEEVQEIKRMHELIANHNLEGKIRWLGMNLPKEDAGEVYRIIADKQGVFVQPARFEGFGLTVLEAMQSGLPTFATQFGGPSEIIIDGESGFLINPTMPELISEPLLNFMHRADEDPDYWQSISKQAIRRVQQSFTWQLYSEKLLNLTALYGFWRFAVSKKGKQELSRYCHLLFQLFYKPRANKLLN